MAVILAVISQEVGGDGWESNPPGTPQQRPADGFEDRGEHQLPYIPSAGYITSSIQMVNPTPAFIWVIVIAIAIVVPAVLMYLVTTFLFAFSGGQYRMVAVVNFAALAMIAIPSVAAAIAWRVRSGAVAAVTAVTATLGGWVATAVTEWVLSFWLGA